MADEYDAGMKLNMLFSQTTFGFCDQKQPMMIFLYKYRSHTSIETDTLFLLFPDLSLEIPAEFQIRKSKSRDPQVCQLEGKTQSRW